MLRDSETKTGLVLGAGVVLMGLLAGVFYAFACGVMPALGDSSDRTFVEAMQQMNRNIENPVFFASLLGAPVVATYALVVARRAGEGEVARWVIAGLAFHAVALLVTSGVNVPLNNDLGHAGDSRRVLDFARVRDHFEHPWEAWNIVRTLATTASFVCLAWALRIHGRGKEDSRAQTRAL